MIRISKEIYENITSMHNGKIKGNCGRVIAVQCVDNSFFVSLFGLIVQDLKDFHNIDVEMVLTRSLEGGIGNGFRTWLMRSYFMVKLHTYKLISINLNLLSGKGYASRSLSDWLWLIPDFIEATRIYNRNKGNHKFADLKVRGVLVGDLIIDTYLRFKPSAEFKSYDRFLVVILMQALRDLRKAEKYFNANNPLIYLSTYSTYIQHGIPVRVALRAGTPVYVFSGMVKKLIGDDYFHSVDTSDYKKVFDLLENKELKIKEAEDSLMKRMYGENDNALSYMKCSPYSRNAAKIDGDYKGSIVVFLHDFFDSPHVVPDMIFDDFWSWVVCTVETLLGGRMKFSLKPHPNQIDISRGVLNQLKVKYPSINFLPDNINNSDLFDAGILCGVSVYGTVAHELAFMGIPTITCARHPHHAFNFCRNATSKEEYVRLLLSPEIKPLQKEEMREESLAFYYMHNLYQGKDRVLLKEQLRRALKISRDSSDGGDLLLNSLFEIRKSADYLELIRRMSFDLA